MARVKIFSFFLDHLFNLKFAAKELERQSKKAEKEEKTEKMKLKKAIQKGNMEVARIHAENAVRQKNQSLNYLRMSARVDAVSSRVQSAVSTRKVLSETHGKPCFISLICRLSLVTVYSNFKYLRSGNQFYGWRCESNGFCHEVHELGEDIRADGQVRKRIRRP